jgi:predicted membrane protein
LKVEFIEVYNALYRYSKKKDPAVKFQQNKIEKGIFIVGLLFFSLAIFLALVSNLFSGTILEWVISFIWGFVVLSQISGILYQLVFILSMVKQFSKPVKNFLEPLMVRNTSDFNFAKSLTQYNGGVLKSVRDSLEYESTAMYSRVGILLVVLIKLALYLLC